MASNTSDTLELQQACESGEINKLKKLVSKANVNMPCRGSDGKSSTLLHIAAGAGHKEIVEYLLKVGAVPSSAVLGKMHPLHTACRKGRLETAKVLVEHGSNVNCTDKQNRTPLHWAAGSGYTEVAEFLLKSGASLDARWGSTKQTPLHYACYNGHTEMARLLLNRGADANVKDSEMRTPLHEAAKRRNLDACRVLLQHKTDPNMKDKDGKTAVDVAADKIKHILSAEVQALQNESVASQGTNQHEAAGSSALDGAGGMSVADLNAALPPLQGDKESDCFIVIDIPKVNPKLVETVLGKPEEYYKMSAKPRGTVIILNNELFDQSDAAEKKLSEREGSSFDVINLSNLFEALGFVTKIWRNLTAQDIRKEIDAERKSTCHNGADAFAFAILSHGTKGCIYGQDGRKVAIQEEIVDMFDGNNCPQLIGKPKMFFIQACLGDATTAGVIRADCDDSDDFVAIKKSPREVEESDGNSKNSFIHHEKADFLVCYATVPGYKSWRHIELGSWFMRDLILAMNQCAHSHEILKILTKANQLLTKRSSFSGGKKQIAKIEQTLIKELYLLPASYQ